MNQLSWTQKTESFAWCAGKWFSNIVFLQFSLVTELCLVWKESWWFQCFVWFCGCGCGSVCRCCCCRSILQEVSERGLNMFFSMSGCMWSPEPLQLLLPHSTHWSVFVWRCVVTLSWTHTQPCRLDLFLPLRLDLVSVRVESWCGAHGLTARLVWLVHTGAT